MSRRSGPDDPRERDIVLSQLAEEFQRRRRRGEAATVAEYAERYPDLAAEIRELFPTIELVDVGAEDEGGGGRPDVLEMGELGEYLIRREIGRGGMGTVYEAEQRPL